MLRSQARGPGNNILKNKEISTMKEYIKTMPKVGPFFKIKGKYLYDAISIDKCESSTGVLDNPCSHESLFENRYSKELDYIDYPRGRVLWDTKESRGIIFIDPCIKSQTTISKIAEIFCLPDYIVKEDLHYHCKRCSDKIWNENF